MTLLATFTILFECCFVLLSSMAVSAVRRALLITKVAFLFIYLIEETLSEKSIAPLSQFVY